MGNTIKLLDEAKAATSCETDYQLAKYLGWKIGTVSMYRTGKRNFDDDAAARIAEILGREPGEVMALCAAERAKTEAGRSRWLRVAALLAATVIPPTPGATMDTSAHKTLGNWHYVNTLRRLLWPGPAVRYC